MLVDKEQRKIIVGQLLQNTNIPTIEQYLFQEEFRLQISQFTDIIVCMSGGYESTALSIFMAKYYPERITYLYNNTLRCLLSARDNCAKLFRETRCPWIMIVPEMPKKCATYNDFKQYLLNQSRKELIAIDQGKEYNKKNFVCCRYLKENPFKHFLHQGYYALNISGLASYEGTQRRIFLTQCRKRNTFLHYNKTNRTMYAYPFRDLTLPLEEQLIAHYLRLHGYRAEHSGCDYCPILTLDFVTAEDDQTVRRQTKSYKVFHHNTHTTTLRDYFAPPQLPNTEE